MIVYQKFHLRMSSFITNRDYHQKCLDLTVFRMEFNIFFKENTLHHLSFSQVVSLR